MKILKKQLTFISIFCAVLLSIPTAYAEDIDVYLTQSEGEGANILFVIDNSGGTNKNFTGSPSFSDGGKTIDEIVYALDLVLDSLAGTARLGIASQHSSSDKGGKIDYPVSIIDEPGNTSVEVFVTGPAQEAGQRYDVIAASWEPIDVSDDTIRMANDGGAAASLVQDQVGLFFPELSLPRFAKITSATLTMSTPDPGTFNNIKLLMGYEVNNAPSLFDAADDLQSRTWSTDVATPADIASGALTADVTDLVQSAVNDSLWCGRNDLVLRMLKSAIQDFKAPELYTYRAQTTDAGGVIQVLGQTRLSVEWDTSDATEVLAGEQSCMGRLLYTLGDSSDDAYEKVGGTNLQNDFIDDDAELRLFTQTKGPNSYDYVAGIRFPDIPFDSTAVIQRATLSATVNSVTGGAVLINSMAGFVDPFMANGDIYNASKSAASVTVPVANNTRFSADVTTLVTEALAAAGWVANNGLGFYIDRAVGTSAVAIHSVDGGAGSAATLELEVLSDSPGDFVSAFSRREEIRNAIVEFSNNNGGSNKTPGSAYVEAGNYMIGETPFYENGQSAADAFYLPPARTRYLSPNEEFFALGECGGNHIILVTHAEQSGDATNLDGGVLDMMGSACVNNTGANSVDVELEDADNALVTKTTTGYWACTAEVAEYLTDGLTTGLNVPVNTHTVVFAPQSADTSVGMEYVAYKGEGEFRSSENAVELAEALLSVVNSVTVTEASLAAPGVAVNQLNRFRHLDQLYYGVFRPETTTRWRGNLKRYKLDDGPLIVDQTGTGAVDPETGFFLEDAHSFWSPVADGFNVDSGGALSKLSTRQLYVAESAPVPSDPARAAKVSSVTTTVITESTDFVADLDPTAYGFAATGEETIFGEAMFDFLESFGDPLHSEPRLINFGFLGASAEAAGADPDLQKNVVFFATNDGMIHAIDALTGVEQWAFMPQEEALKVKSRRTNAKIVSAQRTSYGLDGGLTSWRRSDVDNISGVEHVLLYAGMRRGGSSYHALDVTDAYAGGAPGLMWVIQGGASGFQKLGQTWSTPVLAGVNVNGVRTPVLIFGGGFDPSIHDTEDALDAAGDTTGNALYIVNAWSGALIWSASDDNSDGEKAVNTDMKWSVPSAPGVVDLNFDGLVDHIYFSDLGGQVFRVDINNDNTTADDLAYRVKTFAKLGLSEDAAVASNIPANNRKFFAPPVVGSNERDGSFFLQVAIGSGNRVYPANEATDDRLFLMDDTEVLDALQATIPAGSVMATLTSAELADLTDETVVYDPAANDGWYIDLTELGEKSVSAGAIVNGTLFMTSFLPNAEVDNCVEVIGRSRLYVLDVLDGSAVNDTRYTDLVLPGLPPQAQVIVGINASGDSELSVLVGTAVAEGGDTEAGKLNRTRWYEKDNQTEANEVITEAQAAP